MKPGFLGSLAAVLVAACGTGSTEPASGPCPEGDHEVAGWCVALDEVDGTWALTPPDADAPVMEGEGAPQLAESGQAGVDMQLGAFHILLEDVQWTSAGAAATSISTGQDWAQLDFGDVAVRFEAYGDAADQRLRVAVVPATGTSGATAGQLAWKAGAGDAYFGLGSQTVGMDLAGRKYPLWTQEQGIGKPEDPKDRVWPLHGEPEAAYAPMGVLHSTAGWSLVTDFDAFGEIDLRQASEVTLTTWGEPLAFVLVPGETPKARLSSLTELTGRMERPADWTFGPWNHAVGGPTVLRETAELLRVEGIPSSAIWSEDWIGGIEGPTGFRLSYAWEWDPEQYPDLPADIDWLHDLGFAFLGYFNPFVPDTAPHWQPGVDNGYLIGAPDGDGPYVMTDPAFRDASLVDLTNPDARQWLVDHLVTAAQDLKLDGWMADFAEWLPVDAVLHDGSSGWAQHNRYPLMWQQANADAMAQVHGGGPGAAEGWTFFARSGWASARGGSGGIAPTMWGGDQNTDWERDDGFPTVIPLSVHAGLSGVGIMATDIAGYSHFTVDPTTKELFFRWASHGALTPLMRTHHGSSECTNWSFERDAETLAHYKRWASIHTLLLPYFQQVADEGVERGWPFMRHPWLVEPDNDALWEAGDAYFLGDALWVAPVMVEGAMERAVVLPGSGWWPLFGDAAETSTTAMVQAGPTEMPVFVRPGTALPLLGELVDSHYGATADAVRDLSDVQGAAVALYPDGEGAVTGIGLDGTGWSASVDWAQALVSGMPIGPCGDAFDATESCYLSDGVWLADGAGGLTVGDASLTRQDTAGALRVQVAGAVWGDLASPTELTDLNPDIPPPCEE